MYIFCSCLYVFNLCFHRHRMSSKPSISYLWRVHSRVGRLQRKEDCFIVELMCGDTIPFFHDSGQNEFYKMFQIIQKPEKRTLNTLCLVDCRKERGKKKKRKKVGEVLYGRHRREGRKIGLYPFLIFFCTNNRSLILSMIFLVKVLPRSYAFFPW